MHGSKLSEGLPVCLQNLEEEVARLQAANCDLMKDKEEALPLLQAYRSDFAMLYCDGLASVQANDCQH